jgi:flagellar protein FlaG
VSSAVAAVAEASAFAQAVLVSIVKEAVDLLNNQMASNKRGIGFTVNNDSNTPIVTVRNTSTGEVVRQIPNEVVIKLATGLDNTNGVIHNKQA